MSRSRCLLLFVAGLAGCAEAGRLAGPVAVEDDRPKGGLRAGVAKVEITSKEALPRNDPLYVKALVLQDDAKTVALITLDAVSIGEIGYVPNDFLPKVRARLQKALKIAPGDVVVNASHCHGRVCADVDDKAVEAVTKASANLVPVNAGVGVGSERRIMENRRLKLKDGRTVDVRHAYSLPPDEEIAEVGPVDPQIGVLRLDKKAGGVLAVVYNFACHPIMGVPAGDDTADLVGFASKAIEENLGCVALFVQGCGGDVNPVRYKGVQEPRDAEPLGNLLGLSVLRAARAIAPAPATLAAVNEKLELPRADHSKRIDELTLEQAKLVKSLRGTSLNLKTFLGLKARHDLSKDFPSDYAHRYLHEQKNGKDDLKRLDATNRANLQAYARNVHVMEELTRVQTNLALLQMHQKRNRDAGMKPLPVEVAGLRVGDFVLVTFPGELTVEIGLEVKKTSPHKFTFVAGYTNGYVFYTPTAKQLRNVGGAQEDSDCLVAPEWEELFYAKVAQVLKRL